MRPLITLRRRAGQVSLRTPLLLLACATLLAPLTANAASVTYPFESGSVTLSATVGADFLIDPTTEPLDGLQVTVDTGAGVLESLALTSAGPIAISFNRPYAGYEEIVVESLRLTGGPGPLTYVGDTPDGAAEYDFRVNPLTVSAKVTATGTGVDDVTENVDIDTFASGDLFISPDETRLNLDGFNLGVLGPFGDEVSPIVVKGEFIFSSAPIPEPSAPLLYGMGFATFALVGRRATRRS